MYVPDALKKKRVSILLILDIGLEVSFCEVRAKDRNGFNPSYSGYRPGSRWKPRPGNANYPVSILLILDIGLEALGIRLL